jgi:RHS repeat-associated protein
LNGGDELQNLSYAYDALNRLTGVSGAYSQTYTYNPVSGNLTTKSDVGSYTYSPAHPHAVTQAGSNSYAYDANGNVTERNGLTMVYDAENRLIQMGQTQYLYDGDGKRVAELNGDGTGTVFIGDWFEGAFPQPEITDPDCANQHCTWLPIVGQVEVAIPVDYPLMRGRSYYYADGARVATRGLDGTVSWLYGDHLGSTSVTADAQGVMTSSALYEPWGETRYQTGASPTDYGYTGQMQEGDLYYYGARWYDPQIGRFIQPDTIVPSAQGTQAFDRYAYVNNNPLRYTDPSGRWMCGDQYDGACADNWSEYYTYEMMRSNTLNVPFNYVIQGSFDFGLRDSVDTVDRYSDDMISPSGGPLTIPAIIDFAVRILQEFRPVSPYVAKDDLFYDIYVESSRGSLTISKIVLNAPVEQIYLQTISFFENTSLLSGEANYFRDIGRQLTIQPFVMDPKNRTPS